MTRTSSTSCSPASTRTRRRPASSPSARDRTNAALVDHVLRDVSAKRQLVQYFRDLEKQGPRGATMEHALRLIAQTYTDHPHYREHWRP